MGNYTRSLGLLSAFAAGCGSVSAPQNIDAAVGSDARMIDADLNGSLQVVTHTRFTGGAAQATPVGNIEVVAIRPDGTMSDDIHTDGSGAGTVNVYPGGSVTALYPHTSDAGADLTTFMGVKPNDTLTFGLKFSSGANTSIGTFTVNWPAAVTTSSYVIYTSCGGYGFGTALSGVITEYSQCHQEPMTIVALGYDQTTGQLTYSQLATNVAFTSGGSKTLGVWGNSGTGSMTATNIPAEVTSVASLIYLYVDSLLYYANGFGATAPSNGQYTSPTYQWPGQGTRNWIRFQLQRAGSYPSMFVYDAAPGTTIAYSLALPALPPWITNNSVVSAPVQMATWFTVGNGPQNGTVLRISWSHSGAPYSWYFVIPPGVNTITFPTLPSGIAQNAPHLDDTANINFLHVFNIPEAATYDDVRKIPERTLMSLDSAVQIGDLKRVIMN